MIEVCLEKVESSVNKIDLRIDQVESKVYNKKRINKNQNIQSN